MNCLCFCTQWRSKRGGVGGTFPGAEAWGRIVTLISHLKTRILDQAMHKKCVIFGKKLPNRRSVGGSAPKPPLPSGALLQTPALLQKQKDFNTPYSSNFNIR